MIDLKKYPRLAFWAAKATDEALKVAKRKAAEKAGVEYKAPPTPLLTRVVQNPYTWVGLGFLGAGLYVLSRNRK
jgi:hypothetical protein